ncbi:MAG: PAS domain S-box protein [Nitrospirae bacterium]|nr:MAG: PAS domain S-box protein [Nitrospirota bacterium]
MKAPDFQVLFESAPGLYLVLTPALTIVAVSDAYLKATMTKREEILGRGLFEVFPDNPDDPAATGVRNLRVSLDRVLTHRVPDTMAVQKYDIRRPESEGGGFEERYRSPVNSPVLGADGKIAYIIHRVEDVTEFIRLKQEESEQRRITERLQTRAAEMEAEIFRRTQQVQITERLRTRAAEMEAEIFRRAQQIQEVNNQLQKELDARKQAEQALRESEERFRAVAESATDAIVAADKSGHITYFNQGAERIFGYAARDVISRPLTLLMPQRFHDAHRQGLARFLTTGEARVVGRTVELVGQRKDGTEFPLELSLASWKARGDTFFTGILRDITERKRAEELLRASEERFHLMVKHVEDYAIFMLDAEGRVATWNAGAERIKGYRADEIIGRHFACFYTPDDVRAGKPERLLQEAVSQGRCEDEGWRVRKDGSAFWANAVITALRDPHGTLLGFTKVTRDITERTRLEQEIQQHSVALEAANKELDAFSYSVAHDLRAPLRAIDGFSRVLLEEHAPTLPPEAQHYLNAVRRNSQRMGLLIDDLLAFSRLSRQPLNKQLVRPADLVRQCVDELRAEQQGRRVEIAIGDLPACQADPALLKHVWMNLMSNALKYTRKQEVAVIEVGSREQAGACVYFVKDNGVGIDMQYADKLFGVFQRLHRPEDYEGTGVGLAIVQRVIHRHGGRVWAEAAVNKGATFYFTFEGATPNA